MRGIQIWGIENIGEVRAGDDLAVLIGDAIDAAEPLQDGDILVVTSKIVSKAEGRVVPAAGREDAITAETVRIVATRPRPDGSDVRIVQNRLGIVGAAAGVDASNTEEGTVLLLPLDPDASARRLALALADRWGIRVGIIVSDTLGRPWRDGQTDIAIGAACVHVFSELQGELDSAGRELHVTRPCVADELAAATDLVKGKTSGMPVAVVRGMKPLVGSVELPGAASIIRDSDKDMFRLGADEAYRRGYEAGRDGGPDVLT
jgi:coenzyme F420-0:L-glutamate ligase/coenzyme F420-1:gamma-L-glutamate ligase